MTKQNKFLVAFAILGLSVMILASCGGGSAGKKLANNEFLGNLPNLMYQKAFTDSVNKAKYNAEMKKLDGKKASDWEKGAKISKKYKARDNEDDAKYEAEIEKIKQTLIGKNIPFEVEEGTGYEILSCKISDVKTDRIYVEFEAKVTDVNKVFPSKYSKSLSGTPLSIDKNGKQIGIHYFTLNFSDNKEGTTNKGNIDIFLKKEAAQYADFAKIKFIKKK